MDQIRGILTSGKRWRGIYTDVLNDIQEMIMPYTYIRYEKISWSWWWW